VIGGRTSGGRRNLGAPVAVVLIVTGALTVFGLGVLGFARTPKATSTPPASPAPATSHPDSHPLQQRGLTRSEAVRVTIPRLASTEDCRAWAQRRSQDHAAARTDARRLVHTGRHAR